MNDETLETEEIAKEKRSAVTIKTFVYSLLVVTALSAVIAAAYIERRIENQESLRGTVETALYVGEKSETVDRIKEIPDRLDALTLRIERLEASASVQPSDLSASSSVPLSVYPEIARLKLEIAALKTSLSGVQDVQKQSNNTSGLGQKQLQAALASSLSAVANAGRSFRTELSFLRHASAADPVLTQPLTEIEPLAVTGVPSLSSLQSEFVVLMPSLEVALRKARAMSWQDRMAAEFRGVITIHSTNTESGEEAILVKVADDLAQQKLAAALEKIALLPDPAAGLLSGWKTRAAQRLKLDTILTDVSQHLLDETKAP